MTNNINCITSKDDSGENDNNNTDASYHLKHPLPNSTP